MPTVLGIPILKYHRIERGLLLGPQHGNFGRRILTKHGVTASVSLRLHYDDSINGIGFEEYLQLPTWDGTAPTIEQLEDGVDFIRRIIDNGGAVYVHCQTGLGRGPTMVAAFLMSEGRSLQQACRMIESVRPFIAITQPQFERLKEFQKTLPESVRR